jgi:hypothetical protein
MNKPIASYKEYELYCDLIEDDGFFKKDYWLKQKIGSDIRQSLLGASSYDEYERAVELFYLHVDSIEI